jgi:hypothetical protein
MRPFGGIRPPLFPFSRIIITADQAGGTLLSLICRVLKSADQFDRFGVKKQEQGS